MDAKIAKELTKAIVDFDHPLLDFRSREAKNNAKWVYNFLKPYLYKNCKLIDIGCGTGKQSFAMEELGADVAGLDCSKEAIEYANKIKKKIGSNCNFTVGEYTNIPIEDGAFNMAIFPKNIIECSYPEIEKLSFEVNRILKRNGKFVVTMEDGLEKLLRNKRRFLDNYDLSSGKFDDWITLPDSKKYYYPNYFWTLPFAKNIFSKKFKLLEEIKMDSNFFMLIFENCRTNADQKRFCISKTAGQ